MIKKDLSDMRKHMKLESTMLQFHQLYSVYLKKDNLEVVHKDLINFEALESETQELYIKNFKKLLSGALDSKLFELDFIADNNSDNTQGVLHKALEEKNNESYIMAFDEVVNKIAANYKYESDIVITFITGEYWKGAKKRSEAADEAEDDNVFSFRFLMASINKIDHPKKALQFDYVNREFKASSSLDAIINLNSPLDGFMFPCFNNNYSDINHILYYSGRNNEVNSAFIEEVMGCTLKITAEEEKNCFNAIIKGVVGESIKPEVMQAIYERIAEKSEDIEEGEPQVVTVKDVKSVLEGSGVEVKDIETLEKIYEETIGSTSFDFKVDNILPDLKSKSVKIESEAANISIAPQALGKIKQVRNKYGKKCLLIELDEDIEINGFKIQASETWQE
ncbi:MAG: DUF4317 family protein [Bacillota bacterium]|nr:DUF4317 family protein [Bacillota bacterium]